MNNARYKFTLLFCLFMSSTILGMELPIAIAKPAVDYAALGVSYIHLYKEYLNALDRQEPDATQKIVKGKMKSFSDAVMPPLVDDLLEKDSERCLQAFQNLRILHTSILHELAAIDIEKMFINWPHAEKLRNVHILFMELFKKYLNAKNPKELWDCLA